MVYVAYALISATMWILAWAVVFMRKLAPRRVIGCVFGLQFLALPCGFAAAKLMQWYAAGHIGAELLPYVGFAAVTVLAVAYVFVLPERTLLRAFPAVAEAVPRVAGRAVAVMWPRAYRPHGARVRRSSCCWPVAAT